MATWLRLFWGFFKVGILGYGGGPGSISLIQTVAVRDYHWMDAGQFAETLAVGNALPGPIATKLAASIGWKVAGAAGAAAALLGVVVPSLALMLGLFQLISAYRRNPYVQGLIHGVKPIVVVLLVLLVAEFAPTAFSRQRWLLPAVFFVGGLIAIRWLKVPPALVILASMAGGALFMR